VVGVVEVVAVIGADIYVLEVSILPIPIPIPIPIPPMSPPTTVDRNGRMMIMMMIDDEWYESNEIGSKKGRKTKPE